MVLGFCNWLPPKYLSADMSSYMHMCTHVWMYEYLWIAIKYLYESIKFPFTKKFPITPLHVRCTRAPARLLSFLSAFSFCAVHASTHSLMDSTLMGKRMWIFSCWHRLWSGQKCTMSERGQRRYCCGSAAMSADLFLMYCNSKNLERGTWETLFLFSLLIFHFFISPF